jgi:hypothetical protein
MTPPLRELQQSFGRCLVDGGAGALASWITADGIAPLDRLSVYRNTFLSTLHRALSLAFPAVRRLVGADFFEGAARFFALERPPTHADLNAYGVGFPSFLERLATAATLAYLPDVARLEWAINRALHAEQARPLDAAELAGLDAQEAARLCFTAHPSVSTLRSPYPVDDVWRAVLGEDDRAIAGLDLAAGPCNLLVERIRDEVEVTRLDADFWRVSSALFEGVPLGLVVERHADSDVSAWLAAHLLAGRFTSCVLAAEGDVR